MKNIARLRRVRRWTQTDLADAVGVSQGAISKAERGAGGTSLDLYSAIAEVLGVPLYQLFMDETSEAELFLLQVYRSLPPERQAGWHDMALAAKGPAPKADQ